MKYFDIIIKSSSKVVFTELYHFKEVISTSNDMAEMVIWD